MILCLTTKSIPLQSDEIHKYAAGQINSKSIAGSRFELLIYGLWARRDILTTLPRFNADITDSLLY